jgi:hypothetical protein
MFIDLMFTAPLDSLGMLGGFSPPDPNPNEYDGRARLFNVPAVMRISVHDASQHAAPIIKQTYSAEDGTWQLHALPNETRLMVVYWNDGQYTQLVGAEVLPVNSFVQDHVYAEPYGS